MTTTRDPLDVFLLWTMIGTSSALGLFVLILSPLAYVGLMAVIGAIATAALIGGVIGTILAWLAGASR